MLRLFILFNIFLLAKCSPSVIIIGAGPAGIAAATKLLENNITDIAILEAENRIGGRIRSVKLGETYIDLGAEWCHGQKDNIVYELTKDLHTFPEHNFVDKIFYSDGSLVEEDIQKTIFNALDKFYFNPTYTKENASLREIFFQYYNETVLRNTSLIANSPDKLKKFVDAIPLLEEFMLSSEGAFSLDEPSSASRYVECEGSQLLNWNGLGYKTILEILMKSFPDPSKKLPIDDKIFLNKNVVEIDWNEKRVTTSDNLTYSADYIIFTPSVGVLKNRHSSLFNPQLPQSKVKAIEETGFDGVMKIALLYPNRWWSDSLPASFLWNEEDLKKIPQEFTEGPSGGLWVSALFDAVDYEYNKNVLIIWIVGSIIPEIEKTSPDVVLKGVNYVFKKFLNRDAPQPTKIIFSDWCTNPNFRGTYSFETVEGHQKEPSNQDELAKPLINGDVPVVLFAGEATHPQYFSTVHGAIETGYREAERIINITNSKV